MFWINILSRGLKTLFILWVIAPEDETMAINLDSSDNANSPTVFPT